MAAKDVFHAGIQKFENELDEFLAKQKDIFCENNNQAINSSIEVYMCKICEKRFSSREFISKHIYAKHLSDMSIFEKEVQGFKDEKSFALFKLDENRINK